MHHDWLKSRRTGRRSESRTIRAAKPAVDGLEHRLLLYATLGANWTYGSRITYSFVPDGTNIGGLSSNLFATLNAKFATATWQAQFQKAAAAWETYANINLVNVSDNGAALGSGSYQQGDPNMGDIRISMVSLSSGQLAFAFEPPPSNGGSDAGDIVFNSNISWQINSSYDLMTVALHEFGHALGLDHSTSTSAAMYSGYTGVKQSLTSDDIAGIQSIYGAPQPDRFDSGSSNNNVYTTATNLNSYLNSNAQVSLSGVNLSSTSDSDWYYVTAPSTTNGTLTVTMQSSNLSSLSPKVVLYNSSLVGLSQAFASGVYGSTVTVTITGVTPGQSFYIRCLAASAPCAIGAYGLLVNFGSNSQSPVSPPNTQVLSQPDAGGGTISQTTRVRASDNSLIQVGNHKGRGDVFTAQKFTSIAPINASGIASSEPQGIATITTSLMGVGISQAGVTPDVVPSTWVTLISSTSGGPPPADFVAQAIDDVLSIWLSKDSPSLLADQINSI